MRHTIVLTVALLALLPTVVTGQSRRVVEMGITAPEMAQYFQANAGASDIARVDHPNGIGLISGITVGRKMAIFKSAAQIQQFLASNPGALDIVGYNLEAGQTHDAAELANPVAAAKNVRAIANQYGKKVAIGLTRDLTLRYGAAMAPYADIWVLQIQKAQNDPALAAGFVNQMVPALKDANQAIEIFVQIRTDSSPAALASLVNGLSGVHVSILTQRSDVREAVAVASAFFGGKVQAQAVSQSPTWVGDYGYRLPSRDGKWRLPVATRLLGSTDDDHVGRGSINSWDLSASVGSPVYAAAPGVVEAAGCYLYENRKWSIMQGYGCAVQIKHGDGISSQYGHCLENTMQVKAGQQVTSDTLLCQVGRTGVTSFSHTHFTILRNGAAVRIDGIFDVNLMRRCHLCSGKNDPALPITNGGMVTEQRQETVTVSQGYQILKQIAAMPTEEFATVVTTIVVCLMLAWWLFGIYVRVVILAATTTVVIVSIALYLFMPTQVQATLTAPGQPSANVGGDWVKSYEITQGREGWRCTRDPVRTMGGVTQSTYSRWLTKHGKGSADVCGSLTKEQAKQIFYELFWLPVGADKLPFALAITVVDHYYNTGKVSHLLAKCGTDVKCFNDARVIDYRSKSNCAAYCTAWINRVNHIRTLTEK